MNDDAKYLFDLMGYIVIEDALTPEEVARCNVAIDHRIDQLKSSPSYSGGSKALAGTSTRQDLGGMLSWERFTLLQCDFGKGLSPRPWAGIDCHE
jgi:hypothetical protein